MLLKRTAEEVPATGPNYVSYVTTVDEAHFRGRKPPKRKRLVILRELRVHRKRVRTPVGPDEPSYVSYVTPEARLYTRGKAPRVQSAGISRELRTHVFQDSLCRATRQCDVISIPQRRASGVILVVALLVFRQEAPLGIYRNYVSCVTQP